MPSFRRWRAGWSSASTLLRRRFHHFTFYGFMLCFASTSVATLWHYLLDLRAPYALTSLPVLLGTAGGIGLVIGPAGLLWLNLRRDPQHGDAAQRPMDRGIIALLLPISVTVLALLALRDTGLMALLLANGIFRSAALLKWAIEKRQPSKLKLGDG